MNVLATIIHLRNRLINILTHSEWRAIEIQFHHPSTCMLLHDSQMDSSLNHISDH